MTPAMTNRATFLALFTIILWSLLAYLGAQLRHLSPFLLVGLALTIGSLIGAPQVRQWRVPPKTLALGVYGLFGYHFLLFSAFRYAPAVEANLLNYLWPLLIVLLSPWILPGFSLRPHHLLGALLGLAGAALIVTGGRLSLDLANLPGYLMAAAAAFVWASYSLLTKRATPFPTAAVGGFCLASGLLSLAVALAQPGAYGQLLALTVRDWLYLLVLGAGPMGLAFYTWDAALKQGDPRVIGSLTYLTPLASTLILVLAGGQTIGPTALAAMALILGGAVTGSWDAIRRPAAQP